MCLAYPGKVIKIQNKKALVNFGGIIKEVNVELIERIKIGDYLNVHAGFAIQKLTEKDARYVLKLFSQNEKTNPKSSQKNRSFSQKNRQRG